MTASIIIHLFFGALWCVLVFGSGVAFGCWIAEQNPPDDADSSGGKTPSEERP